MAQGIGDPLGSPLPEHGPERTESSPAAVLPRQRRTLILGWARPATTIVSSCVAAAVLYGITHDLVTTHVSIEYYTLGHRSIGIDHPVGLAFAWGVIATWWVGAIAGIPLAIACRAGSWPTLTWRDLRVPGGVALAVMGLTALVAALTDPSSSFIPEPLPPARRPAYEMVASAHAASYSTGAAMVLALTLFSLARRHAQACRPYGPSRTAQLRRAAGWGVALGLVGVAYPVVVLAVGGPSSAPVVSTYFFVGSTVTLACLVIMVSVGLRTSRNPANLH